MTLTVRTGTALRWRATLPSRVTDLIRVHVDPNGVVLALLPNGFDSGFSKCWPISSRLVLDLFVDTWTSSSGSTPSRLATSVRRSRAQFVAAVAGLLGDEQTDIDPPGATLPDVAVFDARAGDTLLLLSKAALSGPSLAREEAAFAATAYASPAALAERLADVAFRNPSTPFAAVVALRFDAVDVSAELDRLIAAYEPEPRHAAWLGAWARTERALPVSFDMGGVVGLRRDGSVVSVAWDDPGSTREDTSDAAQVAATIGASRNYPALRTLAPARQPRGKACPHCEELRVSPSSAEGCPMCWYLGWAPANPPPWFLRSENGTGR